MKSRFLLISLPDSDGPLLGHFCIDKRPLQKHYLEPKHNIVSQDVDHGVLMLLYIEI